MARQRPHLASAIQSGARGHACERLPVVGAGPQGQAVASNVKMGHVWVPPGWPVLNRASMLSLIQRPAIRRIIPPCMPIAGAKSGNDTTPLK